MNRDLLVSILERARWAPSGDNTQPWRFEIVADDHVAIHGNDTRDWCLYDFRGHASHMAHGALLETLRIAASAVGLEARWSLREGSTDRAPLYDVRFVPGRPEDADPLAECIERRTVQRRPMKTTPLTETQRSALATAPGDGYVVQFFEPLAQRWAIAKLLWKSAYMRLVCPEAFEVHRQIIEWNARFSKDRIPEQAVGVDWGTARLMHWAMQSWGRVSFLNRYMFGTVAPRIQLDVIPGLLSAAHLLLKPTVAPGGHQDFVRLGVAMQRLWLTASQQGLHLQPEMTPVIFRWYARAGESFSADVSINRLASQFASEFEQTVGATADEAFGFMCRVGVSSLPSSRSTRLSLAELMVA